MTWFKDANGAINLDPIVRIVAQTNGDIYLYLDTANYVTVNVGPDQATAKLVAQRMTEAIDPADYS